MRYYIFTVEQCYQCPAWMAHNTADRCKLANRDLPGDSQIPPWCPLPGKRGRGVLTWKKACFPYGEHIPRKYPDPNIVVLPQSSPTQVMARKA